MRPPSRLFCSRPVMMGLLLLALLPFLGLMLFAQPAIDDFDNTATVAKLGRWGAQWYWYWSGRFVAIGVSTLLNPLSYGPRHGAAPAGLWALRGVLLALGLALIGALQKLLRAVELALAPRADGARPWNELGASYGRGRIGAECATRAVYATFLVQRGGELYAAARA